MQPQNPNGLCFVNTEMLLPKQMWEKQRIYICSLGKCDRQFWKITNLELEILTGLPGCNKATVIHVQYIWCHICVHAVCSVCVICDPVDCSPKGSSVHGILQARTLEWVAMFSSMGPSWPRDRTRVSCVSCTGREVPHHCAAYVAQAPKGRGNIGVLCESYVTGTRN